MLALAVSACRSLEAQEPSPESLLRQADQRLSASTFDEAHRLAAAAARLKPDSPSVLQRAAEIIYLSGHAEESLPLFDRVVELVPGRAAQNWQRGIALCTCGDFEGGAEQFKTHHDVNPDDVENSAWYFLCIAKTKGIEAARKTVIPSRGDGRQPMMSVLKMLKGELEPAGVLEAAQEGELSDRARKTAQFYADLYVGLYYDSLGKTSQAAEALRRSQSHGISGYMVSTARVYLEDRLSGETEEKHEDAK